MKSQFVFWGALAWCSLAGTTLALLVRRRRYIRRFEPSPKLRQAIAKANLPNDLPVWETDSDIPAGLVGVILPAILVSQDLVQRLPVKALTVALSHEYAHFARRDHWLRFLLFVTALVFAPVPFAIWLQREWRNASEKAADDLAAGEEKSALFLSLVFKVAQNTWITKSAEQLKCRIERLKGQRAEDFPKISLGFATMICGLAFCFFALYFPPLWLTLHCLAEALMLK